MLRMIGNRLRHIPSAWDDTQPISAEIFGLERSKQHARSLAESQITTDHPPRVYSIIDRLDDNATVLLAAYREICTALAAGNSITPAAEWLVDNYHLVEEQILQTRADLPPGFYRQLPKLAEGPLAGHPRIFGLVWAYVAHTDSHFNPATLTDFVNEYQLVQPLTIGELWAVAISLRLILIENLRRISQRIMAARRGRESADRLADQVLDLGDKHANLAQLFNEIDETAISKSFAVQLIQRLRDHGDVAGQALDWLKLKTDKLGYTFEAAVSDEHHRQASANVTVRNIVTSLRLIADVNWEVWFDSVSLVDQLLRTHSHYGDMDFASRTIYRTAIEELSRGSNHSELAIARLVIDKATGAGNTDDAATPDPGYHLIGPGRAKLEPDLGFKPPLLRRVRMAVRATGLAGYLGSITLLTVITMIAGVSPLLQGETSYFLLTALALLALLPAADVGMALVNFAVTRLMDAAVIPGLALREGVPAQFRTLVVVPTLLTSRDSIEELVDRLEVHYLSNADGELYFALLTDWTDADTENAPGDQALLEVALDGIQRLNLRHNTDRFLLMHRSRKWNPQEGKWMGWERKRGKLHELNRLLRGATDTTFCAVGGKLAAGYPLRPHARFRHKAATGRGTAPGWKTGAFAQSSKI